MGRFSPHLSVRLVFRCEWLGLSFWFTTRHSPFLVIAVVDPDLIR